MQILILGTELYSDDLFEKTFEAANTLAKKRDSTGKVVANIMRLTETVGVERFLEFPTYFDLVMIIMRDMRACKILPNSPFLQELSKGVPVVVVADDPSSRADIKELFGSIDRCAFYKPEELVGSQVIPRMVAHWHADLAAKRLKTGRDPRPGPRSPSRAGPATVVPFVCGRARDPN